MQNRKNLNLIAFLICHSDAIATQRTATKLISIFFFYNVWKERLAREELIMEQRIRFSRRNFIRTTLAGTAFCTASAIGRENHNLQKALPGEIKSPRRTLGRTGEMVSLLGIGCFPFAKKEVSIDDIGKILHSAVDMGINYLDVAPNYGREGVGFAETKMGPVVKAIRKKIFLVSKTEDPSYDGTWRLLEQSLKRLQTDHLDLLLLHNVGSEDNFPDFRQVFASSGSMGALRKAREQGIIRYIGASGHLHPSRFHDVISTGEIDVLMLAVNFIIQHTYDFEHKVWARAQRENIGLVAMKVLGGEKKDRTGICRIPLEYYQDAIHYALALPGISCAVIGIKDMAQLEQAARAVSQFMPLSAEASYKLSMKGLQLAQEDLWRTAYGEPLS